MFDLIDREKSGLPGVYSDRPADRASWNSLRVTGMSPQLSSSGTFDGHSVIGGRIGIGSS